MGLPAVSEYKKIENGDRVIVPKRYLKIACCDCGLVHTYQFRIVKGKVTFIVKRDNRATANIRRAR